MGKKISELPVGTAEQNAVVPATNAAGNATRKVKMADIAALATKQTVGLDNVDNTSDLNKPISTAVQQALNNKASANQPLNTTDDVTFNSVTFPDGTTQTTAAFGRTTTVMSLSYASAINTDASAADIFDVTLTGNTTLTNPTNAVNGKTVRWRIQQDSTGGRTVTLGNKFNLPGSASPLAWSTAPNKMDVLAATYHAGRDKWDIVAFVPGY